MTRRGQLSIAFVAALAIHAGAGVCVDRYLGGGATGSRVIPLFRVGELSIELSAQPASVPALDAAPPRIETPHAKPPPHEPAPTPAPTPVMEPAPKPAGEMVVARNELNPTTVLEESDRTRTNTQPDGPGDNTIAASTGIEASSIGCSDICPYYPVGSRIRGEEGVVRIKAIVQSAGYAEIVEIQQSSGYPSLDKAAVNAVRKARFTTNVGNTTLKSELEVVLSFRFKLTG